MKALLQVTHVHVVGITVTSCHDIKVNLSKLTVIVISSTEIINQSRIHMNFLP